MSGYAWKRLGRAYLRCTGVARRGRYPLECFSTVNLVLKIRVIIYVTHPPLWRSISAMNIYRTSAKRLAFRCGRLCRACGPAAGEPVVCGDEATNCPSSD